MYLTQACGAHNFHALKKRFAKPTLTPTNRLHAHSNAHKPPIHAHFNAHKPQNAHSNAHKPPKCGVHSFHAR